MCRTGSPGTYSRSDWNDTSLSVRSRVARPSRSRTKPVLVLGIASVRGCTRSRVAAASADSRRTRPIGSPRTMRAGPSAITPRRVVGTTNTSSWEWPCAREGTCTSARPDPTGTSTVSPTARRRRGFRTATVAGARSPATTRSRGRRSDTSTPDAPTRCSSAMTQRAAPVQATATSSRQPSAYPTAPATTAASATTRPSGVTTATRRARAWRGGAAAGSSGDATAAGSGAAAAPRVPTALIRPTARPRRRAPRRATPRQPGRPTPPRARRAAARSR